MAIRIPKKAHPQPALHESGIDNEWLTALVNNLSDGFLATDETGKIVSYNGAALGLLDLNIIGNKKIYEVLNLIDKGGHKISLEGLFIKNKTSSSRDYRLKFNDNSTMAVYLSISPIKANYGSKKGGGYVILLRDITQEKSVENERDEFVSVVSHELRTPVAIAEGSLSNAVLLAKQTKSATPIQQSITAAHDQVVFLSNLINDLSMLSRAERGKLALEISEFDAGHLVESLANDYGRLAKVKNLELRHKIDGNCTLRSSQLYVREILQNFLTNAIKYSEKGSVSVSAKPVENGIEFTVADTGIGISKSEQTKLFTKFFRSADWRVRQENGTGLGLYVCVKLAKILGGGIKASSELNHGTTISLFIPNMPAK